MAAAASPSAPPKPEPSSPPDHLPRPSVAISWDSQALSRHAESCELESKALLIDPALLPTLEGLLLEVYAMLRPKPVDYEQRYIMIEVFNKIAKEILGKKNGFPVVEAFGSFTMDLFTPKSDLDLSVNFNTDMKDQFARKDKISAIRKLAKVLHSHQRNGLCYGVLPVVTARVPVLKVIDKGTGIECDISVENKDGMSRSMIFKLISSIDERFQILCYLMKFWAKAHDVNCPKDRTMSSMAIISLVAFHLQTRRPPILPVFSALLKDGSDFASIQRNVLLFEGFGSRNEESVAELFVSLMSKLLSVEGLWDQGLCASNFEGLWISKTWQKGIGNLSVEDFLDRSQNFARSVGKMEMQKICECLRVAVFNLADFFRGKIDAPKLKTLLFGPLNPDEQVSYPGPKRAKRKSDSRDDPENGQKQQKRVKSDSRDDPENGQKQQKRVKSDSREDPENGQKQQMRVKSDSRDDPENGQKQQKRVKQKHAVRAADTTAAAALPPPSQKQQKSVNHTVHPGRAADTTAAALPPPSQKQQKRVNHTVHPGRAANTTAAALPPPTVFVPPRMHQLGPTQPSTQFARMSQHLITPSRFAYGLPPPHLHSAPHSSPALLGQPQGNWIHLNPGIQLQQQAQHMFVPSLVHQPVINGLHPYVLNGAQQIQLHNENRLMQRIPYGTNPNFWR